MAKYFTTTFIIPNGKRKYIRAATKAELAKKFAKTEAGLDIKEIQRIVGHADPTVTLGTYTHYREAQRSESTAQKVREALG